MAGSFAISTPRSTRPSPITVALAGVVILFIVAPLIVVIGGSFTATSYVAFPPQGLTLHWYAALLQDGDFRQSFLDSLALAGATVAVATPLGTAAALALYRDVRRGRALLQTFLQAPLILPTIITAIALLQFLQRAEMSNVFLSLVIGHVLITTPYILRTVSAGLGGLDPAVTEAAEGLGAGDWRILCRVLLPSAAPGIMAGAIFAFIMSFDETTVSLFLSGPDMMPLPVRIYNYIEFSIDPMVAAVSALLIGFAYALVVLLERVVGLNILFGEAR